MLNSFSAFLIKILKQVQDTRIRNSRNFNMTMSIQFSNLMSHGKKC